MSESKPIPVRLGTDVIERLDAVAEQIGSNRAALIRLCTQTFLDYLEKEGTAGLPMNWQEIIASLDGRRTVSADFQVKVSATKKTAKPKP